MSQDAPAHAAASGREGVGLARALRSQWPLLLLVVALLAGAGAAFAASRPVTATAEATLLVRDPGSASVFSGATTATSYVANQVALLTLPSTADRASQILQGQGQRRSSSTLQSELSVSGGQGNDLVTVRVTDREPQVAAAAVDAVVQAYRELVSASAEQQRTGRLARIQTALDEVQRQLRATPAGASDALQRTYEQLLAQRAQTTAEDLSAGAVEVVSAADVPAATRRTTPVRGAVYGGIAGLLLGGALCYVVAGLRRRFADRFEPERMSRLPLLSEVPDFASEKLPSDLPSVDAPASASAEAFRFACTLLLARSGEGGGPSPHVIAMVSAASQAGKSTIAANTAVTAAQTGRRVLAVDGDVSGRGLSFLLLSGATEGLGLTDVLEGRVPLEHALVDVDVPGGATLSVLRGGTSQDDVQQLLSSSRTRALFESITGFDEVVVDVPPLLQVASGTSLALAASTTVVVVPHRAPVRQLQDLLERLEVLDVPLAGYLYNRAPLRAGLGQQSALVRDDRRQSLGVGAPQPRERPRTERDGDTAPRRREAPVPAPVAEPSPAPPVAGPSPAPAVAGPSPAPAVAEPAWAQRVAPAPSDAAVPPAPHVVEPLAAPDGRDAGQPGGHGGPAVASEPVAGAAVKPSGTPPGAPPTPAAGRQPVPDRPAPAAGPASAADAATGSGWPGRPPREAADGAADGEVRPPPGEQEQERVVGTGWAASRDGRDEWLFGPLEPDDSPTR